MPGAAVVPGADWPDDCWNRLGNGPGPTPNRCASTTGGTGSTARDSAGGQNGGRGTCTPRPEPAPGRTTGPAPNADPGGGATGCDAATPARACRAPPGETQADPNKTIRTSPSASGAPLASPAHAARAPRPSESRGLRSDNFAPLTCQALLWPQACRPTLEPCDQKLERNRISCQPHVFLSPFDRDAVGRDADLVSLV